MKTIEVRNNYVYVYYDGTNDVDSIITLMKEIADICKKENIKKLLADVSNMTGEPSIIGRFQVGIAGVRIFKGMKKIAIVYKKVDSNRFAETVAVNRGLPSMVTHDIEKAREWIEED
ncbi:MAG: hypothetical protein KF758_01855 [Anaerolineales bacterium]|nr:hypothetical protein [Anaerolineales bacterium]MBX3035632.1 hypothetical protein [Anaerolineales bacterium]